MPNVKDVDLENVVTTAIASAATQMAADPDNKVTQKEIPGLIAAATEVATPAVREAQARFDYVTNNESLLASWSFNSAMIAVLSSGLTIYGALSDGYVAVDDNTVLIGAGTMLMSAAGWLIGRIRGKPIGQ